MVPKVDVEVRDPRIATGVLLDFFGRRVDTEEVRRGRAVNEAPENDVVKAGVVIFRAREMCVGWCENKREEEPGSSNK